MAPTTSLSPLSPERWGPAQARHLLRRTGFGAEPGEVNRLAAMAPGDAVDALVNLAAQPPGKPDPPRIDPNIFPNRTAEERREIQRARRANDVAFLDALQRDALERRRRDRVAFREMQHWWVDRMIQTPRPLEEKLTLLWHSHFATRYRTISNTYHMFQQNWFLRSYAGDNFAKLAVGIVRDPAMIRFLNNDRNNRRSPNENLARELMELFTVGEGQYTEQDIREAARALTGYHVEHNDFVFRAPQHDRGTKTIFGRSDAFDGDSLVMLLLGRPTCAPFVAYKLYRHFVADLNEGPSGVTPGQRQVIEQLAAALRRSNFALAPVLRTLLLSEHFHDPQIVGRKIKSPAELVVGVVRTLGAPTRDLGVLTASMAMMGQSLFDPPSVAGWDGGRGWINTSTLFARQNLCAYVITGKPPRQSGWRGADRHYDPMRLIAHLGDKSPEPVANWLIDTLLGEHLPVARREPLIAFLRQRGATVTRDDMVAMLLLLTAMPEYQLC